MREKVVISLNVFPQLFLWLSHQGKHRASNTKIELFSLKTQLKNILLQKENAGLVSSCCLET